MRFLGVGILQSVISFFQSIRDTLALEHLFYIFVGLEILSIIIFIVIIHNVYELKLMRSVNKLNAYLYNVQYIDENNLIEFNNRMKKVPKTLRYHWQQYMLYREKSPSYYMSVENCIDRPIKASSFASDIRIIKALGAMFAILGLMFSCGWASGLSVVSTDYFVTIFTIPLVVLFLNYAFIIVLNTKRSRNTSDVYQTFHIFDRFIDKAVTTLPEYVDFEVLFTRKEIKRGIPVLNEYIEKRQIQEQEEMRKAKENAVQHELYDFEQAGEKGELVLERAMKETEVLVNLRNRLNTEIEQISKEMDSYKRTYENTTKDYQKKLQASKENIDRLREQQESTTNRIENNYIRKQQSDEIKKQQQIEKDQDDATLRYNQEINSLTTEIKKRKEEIEEARINVEKAMLSEYKTFSNKIFLEVRENINQRVKDERDQLLGTRESIAKELEDSLSKVEQLEKQNKVLVTKSEKREAFIRAEIGRENKKLLETIEEQKQIIEEKEQHIALISDSPNLKEKKAAIKPDIKKDGKKVVIEGEFSFDDNTNENKFNAKFDGPVGKFDNEGNYRYLNGTYYDAQGYFHDEDGNTFDPQGNIVNKKIIKANVLKEIKPVEKKVQEEEIKINNFDFENFEEFDSKKKLKEEEKKYNPLTADDIINIWSKNSSKKIEDVDKSSEKIEYVDKASEKIEDVDKSSEKIEAVEQVVQVEPAKKRGRPRKEVVEQVAQIEPAKKRGRPRKEAVKQVAQIEPAKKRGRPRKEVVEQVAQIEPTKKRGRPRKEVVEQLTQVEPAKKRGRPRKEVVEQVTTVAQRGRPRKININDLKAIEMKIKKQNDILKGQHEDLKNTVKKATKK